MDGTVLLTGYTCAMSDFTGSPPIDAKLTGAAHPPVLLAGAIGGNDNNDDDGLYKNIFFLKNFFDSLWLQKKNFEKKTAEKKHYFRQKFLIMDLDKKWRFFYRGYRLFSSPPPFKTPIFMFVLRVIMARCVMLRC